MSLTANKRAYLGHTFKAQSMLDIPTWRDDDYPVYNTSEFTFYRCLPFEQEYYGRTISDLHAGNLRESKGRYAKLFPGQRVSYWASDRVTARREVASHSECRNYILFEAYDDASSFIPSLPNQTPLRVADGRETCLAVILEKTQDGIPLSDQEMEYLLELSKRDLDCVAYVSHVNPSGENFLFFEKGFRKLALKEVRLILGKRNSRNTKRVYCADTSDYVPDTECYGVKFEPIARAVMDESYLESDEYKVRTAVVAQSRKRISG